MALFTGCIFRGSDLGLRICGRVFTSQRFVGCGCVLGRGLVRYRVFTSQRFVGCGCVLGRGLVRYRIFVLSRVVFDNFLILSRVLSGIFCGTGIFRRIFWGGIVSGYIVRPLVRTGIRGLVLRALGLNTQNLTHGVLCGERRLVRQCQDSLAKEVCDLVV